MCIGWRYDESVESGVGVMLFFCFGRGGGGMGAIESLDNRQN